MSRPRWTPSISPTSSGDPRPVLELPPYQPATIRAVVAGALIAVATGLEVLRTIDATFLVRQSIDGATEFSEAQEQYLAAWPSSGWSSP